MRVVITLIIIISIIITQLYSLHITLPQAQYMLALELYSKGRYRSAITEFKNLIKEHPGAIEYVANSYYWLGLSYLSLRKYKGAERNFKYVLTHFPKSKYYVNSLYQLGRTYYIWKRRKKAIKIFTKLYKRYPRHELADNALLWRGVSYYKLKNTKRALKDFYTILRRYPRGNKADAARYMITYIKGGAPTVIVKKVPAKEIDTSKLQSWEELLKTKEQALEEKEKELKAKESILDEKEQLIDKAQKEFKIGETKEK